MTSPNFDPALDNFTDGCGNWLEFAMSGQPELGASDPFSEGVRIQDDLNRTDIRLGLSNLDSVAAATGANIVGLGSVSGTKDDLILSYQLYSLPSKAKIGPPILISGTQDQIINELPNIVGEMIKALGLKEPMQTCLDTVGMNADQLAASARINSQFAHTSYSDQSEQDDESALETAAPSSIYTAIIKMYSNASDDSITQDEGMVRADILDKGGMMPSSISAISLKDPSLLQSSHSLIDAAINEYPQNFQLTLTRLQLDHENRDIAGGILDAKADVANAPNSPDAWRTLGGSYERAYDAIQQGKYVTDLTDSERKQLDQYGPYWLGGYEHAVKLDPIQGYSWDRLSEAASFTSHENEAFGSIDQTITLGQEDELVQGYSWALELCQSKWFGSDNLNKYIDEIKNDPRLTASNITDIASNSDDDPAVQKQLQQIAGTKNH